MTRHVSKRRFTSGWLHACATLLLLLFLFDTSLAEAATVGGPPTNSASPGPAALPAYRHLHGQFIRQLRAYAAAAEVDR